MTTNFSCFSFLSDFCFFLLSSFARSSLECLLIAALELILWKEGRRGMVKVQFRTNSMMLEKSVILSFTSALKIWACLHSLSQRSKHLSMAKKEASCKPFVESDHISELLLMTTHLYKQSSHLKCGYALRAKENLHCTYKILQLHPQQSIVL
jgi:hypothetical protein